MVRYLVEAGHTIVQLNDVCSLESAAYLLQYDSVHGTWSTPVIAGDEGSGVITIGSQTVKYTQESDPAKVDWLTEIVCDCTGKFLKVPILTSSYLMTPSACKKVVVSAPVKEAGALNVVLGCNDQLLTPEHTIITNASCTTNCLAPVVRVIKENLGIKVSIQPPPEIILPLLALCFNLRFTLTPPLHTPSTRASRPSTM